jgi:hypothetical protein
MNRSKQAATSLSEKWDRSRQLLRQGARVGHDFHEWDEAFDLERDVQRGRIQSLEDAVAKLRAIELAFVEGERTDGADATALRQTIRWLLSHTSVVRANDA